MKPKIWLAVAAVVLVAVLVAAWSYKAAEERRRAEEIVTAQGLATVIDATFAKANALKVGEISGTLDVTSVDPGRFRIFSSSQKVVLPYSVDYSIDLSRLTTSDLRWDAERRTLTVEVPDVATGKPNVDEARRRLVDTDGLYVSRRASENLSRRAAVLAAGAAAREAAKPEHLGKARANARNAIANLLQAPLNVAGYGDVTVEVRFPQDAVRDGERWDVSPSIEDVLANRP